MNHWTPGLTLLILGATACGSPLPEEATASLNGYAVTDHPLPEDGENYGAATEETEPLLSDGARSDDRASQKNKRRASRGSGGRGADTPTALRRSETQEPAPDTRLDLSGTTYTPRGFGPFLKSFSLGFLCHLETLLLPREAQLSDHDVAVILGGAPKLHTLHYKSKSGFTKEAIALIAKSRLKSLHLEGPQMADENVSDLLQEQSGAFESLTLRGPLTVQSLKKIVMSSSTKNLKYLKLQNDEATPQRFELVAEDPVPGHLIKRLQVLSDCLEDGQTDPRTLPNKIMAWQLNNPKELN